MTTKQRIVSRLFGAVPRVVRQRLPALSMVIPYYHMIRDTEVPYLRFLYKYKNVEVFKRDIDYFAMNYKVIGLPDLLKAVSDDTPFQQQVFLLTFDDGFREIGDIVAPILMRKGIPATIFLNSAFIDGAELCHRHKVSVLLDYLDRVGTDKMARAIVAALAKRNIATRSDRTAEIAAAVAIASIGYNDRDVLDLLASEVGVNFGQVLAQYKPYLSVSQVKELVNSGFSVGAHSIDHPDYKSLVLSEQVYQTVESVRQIRSRFDLSYGAFAFPHSDAEVGLDLFEKITEAGLVDMTFGNGGIRNGTLPKHFYRFSMDNPSSSPQDMMVFQQVRKIMGRS